MTTAAAPTKNRRTELILSQIDSLPTLPVIATRLLTLTSSDDSHAREVIQLVSADPTLTAKVLSMCRKADRGLQDEHLTVDKAVVLLGYNAIRNAALSIKVFEVFDNPVSGNGKATGYDPSNDSEGKHFNRVNFWRHSLAVGIAAELIASAHPECRDLPASEAFVCGLLHDVGKLALDYVLPKSFDRVVELTELNQGNIAEFERRIMGLDHLTAGKRLAEQWGLPYWIQDCIWLHGANYATLPRLPHRRMIGLVTLADLVVRRHYIGYSGNFIFNQNAEDLAIELELKPRVIDSITHQLHEELQRRTEILGLDDKPSRELFLHSIQQANQVLGRLNNVLDRRTQTATHQAQVLDTISSFHRTSVPSSSIQDVFDQVVANAAEVLGAGYYGVIYQEVKKTDEDTSDGWLVCQYNTQAQPTQSQIIEVPAYSPDLADLTVNQSVSLNLMGILPWMAEYLVPPSDDGRNVFLLPLVCGWGTIAVLMHDQTTLPPANQLHALTHTWGASIAAAAQHEGARRLGEDLAEANRALGDANHALAQAQSKLLQAESLARLGEMASGAAHEMNNPLAIISGRSQLLTMTLPPGSKGQQAAQTIVDQSHRLSDLISALRMFADPPPVKRRPTDIGALLDAVVKTVHNELPNTDSKKPISLQLKTGIPPISIDPDQISRALIDLLLNATQSSPKSSVHVTGSISPEKRLIIQIIDDGKGMDEYTLAHAVDPFFSSKPAGRQMGMGLTRAQLIISAHQGKLTLHSTLKAGTIVTVMLPLDSTD